MNWFSGVSIERTPFWADHVDPAFAAELRDFTDREIAPQADRIDREDVYPADAIRAIARAGYATIFMPPEFGGAGKGYRAALAVFEEVSYASAAVGISLITILQAQTIIHRFGADSLKARWLPRFKDGLLSSYALTEANHGSDIRSLDTKARREGDEWVLDGEKSFITSGSAAELFVILAETEAGVSAFAVPHDTPGVSTYVGEQSATFGLRNGPHVNLVLDGARLPADHLIGEDGKGVRQAVTTLDFSRTMAAGISNGIARAAFDGALAFARARKAFDRTVAEFQGIQWYFAEMLSEIDAARALTYQAAQALDDGHEIARWSSEAKLLASRCATRVAEQAVQICGAYGVMENAPFGRYLRDAKAYEIAGGSSEILKNTIAKHILKAAP